MAFVSGGKFRRYHGESLLAHAVDVRTLALNARDFFRVFVACAAALKILRRVRPQVVFLKGGFIAVPVGLAAKLLKIPIITHDSDANAGLANRLVGRWAVVNTTGMPAKYYPYPKQQTVHVGIPLPKDLRPLSNTETKSLKSQLHLPKDSLVLLVAGGGHGSLTINNKLVKIAPKLLESNLSLHIVHIAGRTHENNILSKYRRSLSESQLKRVLVMGFSDKFSQLTAVSDLIVSRAGATSIAEFAALSKACIIIPSPFLAGGHQLKNAEELQMRDAAVVAGNDISPDELLVLVSELLRNDHRRWQLAKNLNKTVKMNAATEIAKILLKVAKPLNAR